MTDYSTPTPTPGTTPRSIVNGTGVPPPVVPPTAPVSTVAPVAASPAAGPSVATRAAGQRQAMMTSLTPGYDARANAILNPGGKQGLSNYGGMAGPIADTIHKLDGYQI